MPRQRGMPARGQIREWRDFSDQKLSRRRHSHVWHSGKGRQFRKIRCRMVAADTGTHRCGIAAAAGIRCRAGACGWQAQLCKSEHHSGEETGEECESYFHD